MTFWYWLLRIPGNEREFIKKMEIEGISSLDIILDDITINYDDSVIYFPILQARGKKMKLKNLSERVSSTPNTGAWGFKKLDAESKVFKKVLSRAYNYQERGFKVTIVGKPVEEARKIFDNYYSERMAILIND